MELKIVKFYSQKFKISIYENHRTIIMLLIHKKSTFYLFYCIALNLI